MAKGDRRSKYIQDFADIPVARPPELVEVPIPEWSDTPDDPETWPCVLMRRISQGERKRFNSQSELGVLATMQENERQAEMTRWRNWYDSGQRDMELIKMSFVTPDGRPLFSDAQIHELMESPDARPWVRLLAATENENLITAVAVVDFQKNLIAPRSSGHAASLAPSASKTPTESQPAHT